jgi:lipopolysaccharide export system protein LptA
MLVVFLAVVVGLYVLGRMGRPEPSAPSGDLQKEERGELVLSGKGFEYGMTQGDREIFRIKAERILSDKENNYELEGVDLRMEHEDGSLYYLASDQALYNIDTQAASFTGNVHFRGPNKVELMAEGLELREEGQLLVSSSPVDFLFLERFSGRADRLRVNPRRNVFVLAGRVEVDTLPGDESPMSLRCRRFSFQRDDRLLRADGSAILTRGDDELRARRVSVVLTPDEKQVEFILARWGVEAEFRQDGEDGLASTVRLGGRELSVQFEIGTEDPKTADLAAGDKGTVYLGVTDDSGLSRSIRSRHLVGDFESGALRRAQAFEKVEISEFLSFAPSTVLRTACGDEAVVTMTSDGAMNQIDLTGSVMLQENDVVAFGDDAHADLTTGLMELTGTPSLLVRDSEQLEAPKIVYDQNTEEIVAEEGVRAVLSSGEDINLGTDNSSSEQPIRIEGTRAEWGGTPPTVAFVGQVRAWQGENFLVSDELRGEPETSRVTATGRVKTVWRPDSDQADEAGELPPEPLEVTANEMVFDREENILLYRGAARAVQLQKSLRCDEIQLFLGEDGGFDMMICEGSVFLEDGESGNTVVGERATYRPGDDRAEVEGTPVVLRDSDGMQLQGKTLIYDFTTATAWMESAPPQPPLGSDEGP